MMQVLLYLAFGDLLDYVGYFYLQTSRSDFQSHAGSAGPNLKDIGIAN